MTKQIEGKVKRTKIKFKKQTIDLIEVAAKDFIDSIKETINEVKPFVLSAGDTISYKEAAHGIYNILFDKNGKIK